MEWLQNGLLVAGFGLLMLANLCYVRRTQDLHGVLLFWRRRLGLNRGEFHCQRIGIVLILPGVVLRYLMLLNVL
ncbi:MULTISPECIES: hypothetical protein [unclassified Modicisalibacter]|uniref:hypothetical protein n=1 Tax=unclassified Modicisalibacter TaxID=2679913 RepID=UPI001CCC42F1|nr:MULTISPECIES: hypothetical protein [unclassified Modicisalibacter]MBZ9559272.1 hypothetical protein [Modicisalibacter sp. R2A 31.J]MBZ9576563.1 hypothetical protein [Modicisalibacter sp. MOD 31.J]